MHEKITIKTPGKLMVAGEYAVLEPYQPLVVTAVNRFVYVTIEKSDQNKVSLIDFNLHHLPWLFENNKVIVDHTDKRLDFIKQAKEITLRYLKEIGVAIYPVAITVKSELDDESGIKYGLGSSAAVTTGIVQAILQQFLPEELNKLLIFKLASIAHVMTQGNGSGADIAASTYGCVLEYTSFQAEWLLAEMNDMSSVARLVEKDWTYLSLLQVQFPDQINIFVGWTGNAASTKNLVSEIKGLKVTQPKAYEQFLQQSKSAVTKIITGMKENNQALFFTGIEENRKALFSLGQVAKVEIETEALYQLSNCAKEFHGAGKLSGAGGGDCGIAFIPTKIPDTSIRKKWIEVGIQPLDIKPFIPSGN